MTAQADILLLADPPVGSQVQESLGPKLCAAFRDPYDALEEMSRRPWRAVVLAGGMADLGGLCRAARRLQRTSRLLAICTPAEEGNVRDLVGGPLDDYFIYPLSQQDLREIRQAAAAGNLAVGQAEGPAALAGRYIGELVQATADPATLEARAADLVASLIAAPVAWVGETEVGRDAQPLLRAGGPNGRALVPQGPVSLSQEARQCLAAAQASLPALLAVARKTEELYRLSITDHLTGAYNRRYFYARTDEILLRAQREHFHVTVLLYDIDDFKRYNDTYGHAAGDEILRDTARLMKRITRAQDNVARIGGDEFAVLFSDGQKPRSPGSKPPETARALVERFRKALHAHAFPSLGPEAKGSLTISGGLASHPADGRTVRELLRRADAALCEAKRSGKDAVHLVGREG